MNADSAPPAKPDAPPTTWEQIRQWRKGQRERLIAARMSAPLAQRLEQAAVAKQRLRAAVDLSAYQTLGIYWPLRGEMDVRDLARAHILTGGVAALPVVVQRNAAVEFWRWEPGMNMTKGIWDIPIPAERNLVQPDLLIVPLVGFDSAGYRLGYGGGYYDRTLAGMKLAAHQHAAKPPFCVGLGFASAALPSIFPQPHDIPMDLIITEQET